MHHRRVSSGCRRLLALIATAMLAATQLVSPASAAVDPEIVFTNPVAANGITAWPGDPDKTPEHATSSRLGVPCWQTSNDLKDQYIYLNIDAARIPAGATDAVLTVNYFDSPGQQLTAQYDSVSASFTPLPWFSFPGSGTWATTQLRMSGVNFQNRANGADIRLMANAPGGVISSVCVSSVSVSFADTTGITVTNQSLVFKQGTGSVTLTSAATPGHQHGGVRLQDTVGLRHGLSLDGADTEAHEAETERLRRRRQISGPAGSPPRCHDRLTIRPRTPTA
ncbi:hypothetical protein ABZ897_37085 [Nonomuraea sp. NPDC046802]|uniref:hypothetical protein n=1 Tax=Nonomuraea sp. NPDC046802 TaxID=3154919 RepID=UPI0033FB9575